MGIIWATECHILMTFFPDEVVKMVAVKERKGCLFAAQRS
jgi:hypothetical protein